MLDTFRDRVWALIDAYKADLPPELEQDRDRALALTCVQALVTQKLEKHAFRDRQRRRPFIEQESDEAYETDVRSRLREFIANRGTSNEAQIAALNLARLRSI